MEPRYKTLPDKESVIPSKHTLFGLHLLPRDANRVIVVEGPIDQFRMGPGTVATYGTGVTDMQIQQLVAFDRVTVMFDGNEAGRIGAEKLAASLAVLGVPHVEVFDLPNNVEPDTWDEIERLTFLEDFWRAVA
jgi:DNA primase